MVCCGDPPVYFACVQFFGWNFIAGFYAFVYTVYEKRDRKDFGVKAGRGENILRDAVMSLSPMAHTPWDVRRPSKINNMTALLSGISII